MTSSARTLAIAYWHVDVFSPLPFGGNSLAVFPDAAGLRLDQMRDITREMRHFESIFVLANSAADTSSETMDRDDAPATVRARVFDLMGELEFAGHPVLGAACVLHARLRENAPPTRRWSFELGSKTVSVETQRVNAPDDRASAYRAVLDQGAPDFLGVIASERSAEFAEALGITRSDLHPALPLEVVSTGLRYLIVPIRSGLSDAHIARPDFEALLAAVGADFAYLLDLSDPLRPEGRHWNNDGALEDVATGSGAGCAAAYLARHAILPMDRDAVLHQGRFTGRPSEIRIRAEGRPDEITRVLVGGDVVLVGRGTLDALPNGEPTAGVPSTPPGPAQPLACIPDAIDAAERPAHFALAARLFGERTRERRAIGEDAEEGEGYAFRFDADAFEDVARFVVNERRCCPFLAFSLTLGPSGGPLWLGLTGPSGTRAFLNAEFSL